jgi:aminoglycoside 3-N-acetyltransferase
MDNTDSITRDRIKNRLIELGLKAGDLVMLHSSLSSMGHVEGGAETVIDAILDVLGNEGTLMVPTHTGCRTPNEPSFDLYNTPSGMGKITECLRLRKGALRSLHPTHSDCAIGALAFELVKDHQQTTPVGPLSPVGKFMSYGGYVLLLGVGFEACTAIHVLEQRRHMLTGHDTAYILDHGQALPWPRTETPGHSGGFGKIEPLLRQKGLLKEIKIGRANVMMVHTSDLQRVGNAMLDKDPTALLCDKPDCKSCSRLRTLIRPMK